MALPTLGEKFINDLAILYDAERRFLESQRGLLPNANSPELQMLIKEHIQQTEQQMVNLEQIFIMLGTNIVTMTNHVASTLGQEAHMMINLAQGNLALIDCAIADALGKVEHFEIASYRNLLAQARQIGQQAMVQLLTQNLQQEEQTAQRVENELPNLLQKAVAAQELGA